MPIFAKIEALLRFHRQNVFNDRTGDLHHRAILRLKRTKTFKLMLRHQEDNASVRLGERLTRMGY